MNQKDISFYGYNDGKAITIYNCLCLFYPTLITLIISLIMTIFAIVFSNYYLLVIWILFVIFVLVYLLNLSLTKYNDKVFLKGAKKKHVFTIRLGLLYKDGKVVKDTKSIRLYKFKKSLFLVLKKSYYRIPNDSFVNISREDFLLCVNYHRFSHRIYLIERKQCPCCGYYTLESSGMYEICPVCFWENSCETNDDNEYDECNGISLSEAKKNYLLFGACKKNMIKYVRKPRSYEEIN